MASLITHGFYAALLSGLMVFSDNAAAQAFPVSVKSCDREIIVKSPPQRAVSHGSNLTEIMLALQLENHMAGYMGEAERMNRSADLFPAIQQLQEVAHGYPTLETMLESEIDFYFAGWSYGMRVGGEVTPETLAAYNIPVYELSESCIRLGQINKPDFDYLYRDLENLAAIFGVPERAEKLISSYRQRLAKVLALQTTGATKPSIFIYDSGDRVAVSAGALSMPQAIIDAAGGTNILDDMASSWVRVDWETIAERDPEMVVIVDYGAVSAAQKIAFMTDNPAFSHIKAIRNHRFLVLTYDELTPGPRNIDAVEKLSSFLQTMAVAHAID